MKINNFSKLLLLIFFAFLFNTCAKEGPVGPQGDPGQDGQSVVYYSSWHTPNSWLGEAGDWYFDVTSTAISENIVETGIILAYISVPNDLYPNAVRPLPAYALGANWDYLIPDYGSIEFTCDSETVPGTANYFFRFIVIPSGVKLKSTSSTAFNKAELMKMEYIDLCRLLNIAE